MTGWHEGTLLALDFESTGISVEDDRIVTATLVLLTPGEQPDAHEWLINPGIDIPAEATKVHGITTEHATEHGMDPRDALGEIAGQLAKHWTPDVPLVVFNAPFDLTLLDRECRRHNLILDGEQARTDLPVIDPFVIDKHVDKYRRGKRTLGACCTLYGVDPGEAHTSAADTVAAAGVARALARRYPHIAAMTLAELHQAQVGWRAEWAESFTRHLASKAKPDDKPEVVNGQWPLIPHPSTVPAEPAVQAPVLTGTSCGALASDKRRRCTNRPGHGSRHTYDAAVPKTAPIGVSRIPQANRTTGFYTDPETGQRLRSVTTILNQGVPKEALIFWAGNTVAECAMENLPKLVRASRRPQERKDTYDWLRRAHTRKKDERADIGSAVHRIIEAHLLGEPLPADLLDDPEMAPYLEHFLTFVSDFGVTFEASEMVVANHEERYAGTLDYLIRCPIIVDQLIHALLLPPDVDRDVCLMGDTKTGGELDKQLSSGLMHGVYPEAGLQMSAYRACPTAWLRDGTKVPMPATHPVGIVLHLRPKGYRVYPARCDGQVFDHFRYARRVAEWTSETSKSVLGPALPIPVKASA